MTIPGYQEFMYPFLKILSDREEHRLQELYLLLAKEFSLSEEDIEKLLPSGNQRILHNRIGWARTYLSKAGLIQIVRRGVFQITDEGLKIVNDPSVHQIDNKFLMKYKSFQTFKQVNKDNNQPKSELSIPSETRTPNEILEQNYNTVKDEIKEELLEQIFNCSPAFFEKLVVQLLVALGYGGSLTDAGSAIGKSGDGGIDGIIKEDILGLDMIYLQAKRWRDSVSRPEIQKFAGSLDGKKARKGVFITTSVFTEGAKEYVRLIEKKIILIDGKMLTELMFNYNVGVTSENTFIIKRVDLDYFEE
ncbi:restriction endonuclease [Bacillus atrophaeus]|uniref:restriction endonuclease n=1 Tax=Bacillus atrophaeus TaxID=1452 RepID=UPI000B92D4F9|nr:restriction endonuclease [Bacillus atrophaeus]ASS73227.1 restriction endonuclease [Bacillus atrophaeus]